MPRVRPGPCTDAGLTQTRLDACVRGGAEQCLLRLVLRAFVGGEEMAAMRGALAPDRASPLADRRGRGRVDESANTRSRRRAEDVERAVDVDPEEGRRIAEAEGVHPGGVVHGLAALECGAERRRIEDVARDRLRTERREGAGRLLRADERPHRAALLDQADEDPPADEAGAAGQEHAATHVRGVVHRFGETRADEKRIRYSTADITVTKAAASIAHSSSRSGPSGSSYRRMASRIATNWTFVFSFPQIEGAKTGRRPRPRRAGRESGARGR